LKIALKKYLEKVERATGIEPVLPAWESRFSILYSQYLQNCSEKMYVHATHTVHAMPDLRIAAGRLRDDACEIISRFGTCFIEIIKTEFLLSRRARLATVKFRELNADNLMGLSVVFGPDSPVVAGKNRGRYPLPPAGTVA
jgi:hypothetical protein